MTPFYAKEDIRILQNIIYLQVFFPSLLHLEVCKSLPCIPSDLFSIIVIKHSFPSF